MDIFISYASEQRSVAEEITLALRGEGHRIFFDRTELPEGDAYNARIREAIGACEILIFLVSHESVAEGRYTLTELRFAEEKWPSPVGRVLPVMLRATDVAAIPAYLRAVVMLRPAGNIPAEVVAAVDRLAKPRWVRVTRRLGVALCTLILIGGGFVAWRGVQYANKCGEALQLIQQGKLQQSAGDYSAAWDRYASGFALCPDKREVAEGQERMAMDWLENIRVTAGKETFTGIVEKVQPVLSRAATVEEPRRAANALAHLGWGDFLRSREGHSGLDPMGYYRQALQRDPDNPYAHAFIGHYIMVKGGDLAEAKTHFDNALVVGALRPFVRELQIAALLWRSNPDLEIEVVRHVNGMRISREPLPGARPDELVSKLWTIYYQRLFRGSDKETFFAALPAQDLLDTFLWLFPAYDNTSNREPYRFMVAQLQERSGDRAAALASYRSLLGALKARGENTGALADATRNALQRLQSP